MKQYKLIIREKLTADLSAVLGKELKAGWRLNSYSTESQAKQKTPVVLVFEK